jgi:hypothetical protein
MNVQELREQTAICGIDCFNCEFFRTNIDGFFASMPAERKAAFEARGMTLEKMRCLGCRKTGCTAIEGKCETLACAQERKVEFCYECKDFPCQKLQPMADGAERFPHNLKVFNLTAIKNRGIEAWAAEAGMLRMRYFRGKFRIGAGPQLPNGR